MRLQRKLSIVLPVMVLLPVVASLLLTLPSLLKQQRNTALEQTEQFLQQAAVKLASDFSAIKREVSIYAHSETLQGMDYQRFSPFLKAEKLRSKGRFEKIIVGTLDGGFYNTEGANPYLGGLRSFDDSDPNAQARTIARRDYWQATIGSNSRNEAVVTVSNPMVSYTTGAQQVVIAASIINDKQLVGMIGVSIDWDHIKGTIKQIKEDTFSALNWEPRFFLTSKDGVYWYHWDANKAVHLKRDTNNQLVLNADQQTISVTHSLLEETPKAWRLASRPMMSQKKGRFRYFDQREDRHLIVSFTPIDDTSYSLGMVVVEDEILAPLQKLLASSTAIYGLSSIFSLLMALWLARKLASPLVQLSNYANELKDGHRPPLPPLRGNNEVGQLATALDDMAQAVTERQERLQLSEERFSLAMQGANDGVWDWNLNTDHVYFSPRWLDMLGYANAELPEDAETFFSLVHPDDAGLTQQSVDQCVHNRAPYYRVNFRMLHKDGSHVHILSRAYLVCDPETGAPRRLVGTHVDMTEQHNQQLRIEQLNNSLESRVQSRTHELEVAKNKAQNLQHQAEAANSAKSQFLANMSHELRTPLNSIIGFTGRLLNKLELDPRSLDALQAVENNGKHLLNLINDLLDTARIESGSITLRREDFCLIELCQQALSQIQPLIEGKGLQVNTDFSSSHIRVRADRKYILQIILNLLSNAIKYTLEGSITLAVNNSTQQGIEGVRLAVSDTGIGIDERDIPRLFERFSRLDTSRANAIQGTGLGLILIKEMVELHGGRAEVSSTLGRGSCFSIWIPRWPEED